MDLVAMASIDPAYVADRDFGPTHLVEVSSVLKMELRSRILELVKKEIETYSTSVNDPYDRSDDGPEAGRHVKVELDSFPTEGSNGREVEHLACVTYDGELTVETHTYRQIESDVEREGDDDGYIVSAQEVADFIAQAREYAEGAGIPLLVDPEVDSVIAELS